MSVLKLNRTSLTITFKCNLRCALCCANIPYIKDQKNFDLNFLKESITRYFKIVNKVEIFVISGGEPMLHPDLSEIIDYLTQYKDQIGRIELITNGTIVPNEKVIKSILNYGNNFTFLVDNYGENSSIKVNEIEATLLEYNITHRIRSYSGEDIHCGGWVDYGDLVTQTCKTQKEIEIMFAKCAHPQKMSFCFGLTGETLTPCGTFRKCLENGTIDNNYTEYVNIYDDSLSVEEQRDKLRNIMSLRSLSACAYCKGMSEDSERFTPAVQLTKEEEKMVKKGAKTYAEVKRMMRENRN